MRKLFGAAAPRAIEVSAVLPIETNAQQSAMHDVLNEIVDAFGGCQLSNVLGFWKDAKGELVTERCQRLTVMLDPAREAEFDAIVHRYGREAGEQAVYIVGAKGPSIVNMPASA
jgi:hypothetical protein